jgi:hypothetical protein
VCGGRHPPSLNADAIEYDFEDPDVPGSSYGHVKKPRKRLSQLELLGKWTVKEV